MDGTRKLNNLDVLLIDSLVDGGMTFTELQQDLFDFMSLLAIRNAYYRITHKHVPTVDGLIPMPPQRKKTLIPGFKVFLD